MTSNPILRLSLGCYLSQIQRKSKVWQARLSIYLYDYYLSFDKKSGG